jgi:predicted ferric reductase
MADASSPFSQGWPIWAGWLSLLFLMFGLAATFIMRIPYQIWRLLHFGLGVGVLFGLVHLALLGISESILPIFGLAVFFFGVASYSG